MVIDNEQIKPKLSAKELVTNIMYPEVKGSKKHKKPTNGELVKENQMLANMSQKLYEDNEEITKHLFQQGLILCAVHKAATRIYNTMGGVVINVKLERHKRRIQEIIKATETWKDWDKSEIEAPPEEIADEQEKGQGPDSD